MMMPAVAGGGEFRPRRGETYNPAFCLDPVHDERAKGKPPYHTEKFFFFGGGHDVGLDHKSRGRILDWEE